jgi:hypothetical protein
MDFQLRLDEARDKMNKAEISLKSYAVNGGQDTEEYQRLLEEARAARTEFLRNLNTLTNPGNRLAAVQTR